MVHNVILEKRAFFFKIIAGTLSLGQSLCSFVMVQRKETNFTEHLRTAVATSPMQLFLFSGVQRNALRQVLADEEQDDTEKKETHNW